MDLSLAAPLVRAMLSWAARSTRAFLFWVDTLWAISAQYVLLCISRSSRSFKLLTTNFKKPLGRMCLVFLLDP